MTFLTAALCAAVVVVAAVASSRGAPALLLPDLVQAPPTDVSIRVSGDRVLLGFASAVANAGAGPLTIRASRQSRSAPAMRAVQVIGRAGGGTALRRPGAGVVRYTKSPTHEHWHLLGFDRYTLRRAGSRQVVVADRKTGFCLGDRYPLAGRPLPARPALPSYRTTACGLGRPDLLQVTEGISVGYGDDYDAYLEGQSLDITGVPDGAYELVHRVNADGRLLEQRMSNNASCLGIVLARPRGERVPRLSTRPCD